ncbi:MAG TPA: hypothetical protein VG944_04375 [Fimbriimonas sp.]|nr:hypothetical protein [Fimbriimonas sp.]
MASRKPVDLTDTRIYLKRYKWTYILVSIVLVAAASLYTMTLKPIYGASALLLFKPTAEQIPELIVLRDRAGPMFVVKGVLETDLANVWIAKAANIPDPEYKGADLVDKVLNDNPDSLTQQLEIRCDDLDSSEQNMKLVKAALNYLDQKQKQLSFSAAAQQAEEYGKTLREREADLRLAEERLRDYVQQMKTGPDTSVYLQHVEELQEQYGSAKEGLDKIRATAKTSIEDATKLPSAVPSIEAMRSNLINSETILQGYLKDYGPAAPQVIAQEHTVKTQHDAIIAEAKRFMESMHKDIDPLTADYAAKFAVAKWQLDHAKKLANIAPQEAMVFARLGREVDASGKIVEALRAKYEEFRIEAHVQDIQWLRLDDTHPDRKPNNKNFLKNGLLALVAALAASTALTRMVDKRRIRRETLRQAA